MRFRLAALVASTIISSPVGVQAQVRLADAEVEATSADPRIAAVITRVGRLDRALVEDDRAGFSSAMASDLVVNNPQNRISKPGDAVARNASGQISYDRYERSIEYAGVRDSYVILMGEEIVVPKGTTVPVHRRFTDLWMPIDGEWRLTARQATIITRP